MSNETKQAVDHRSAAQRCLDWHPRAAHVEAAAQVHASLAIHDQLERLNETLKEAPHLLDQIAVGVNR